LSPLIQIYGTPTSVGSFNFSAGIKDSQGASLNQNFSVKIGPLGIVTESLPKGMVGQLYSALLSASGNKPPFVWSLSSGLLPPGLTLTPNGNISGNPAREGTFQFTIAVSDSASLAVSKQFTVFINKVLTLVPVLPDGIIGELYTETIASGGTPSYFLTVESGLMPPGLLFSNGQITGAPSKEGVFAFTLHLRDSSPAGANVTQGYRIKIGPQRITTSTILNSADYKSGPVAPGEIVTIFGLDLGPDDLVLALPDEKGFYPSWLSEAQVFFDKVAAPLLYVSSTQAGAIAPFTLTGQTVTDVRVEYRGARTNIVRLQVENYSPAMFSSDGNGKGPAAAFNEDGSLNSPANPAASGSIATIYANGLGIVDPLQSEGQVVSEAVPKPVANVSVYVGGAVAQVLYAGSSIGLLPSLTQVNLKIPTSGKVGDLTVVIAAGSRSSQSSVTLSVK
jgi:uncharacterized protein (TIGR03437 family)